MVDRRQSSLTRSERPTLSSTGIVLDNRYAVAKVSQSGVQDKVPDERTLIFVDI